MPLKPIEMKFGKTEGVFLNKKEWKTFLKGYKKMLEEMEDLSDINKILSRKKDVMIPLEELKKDFA